jgi:hypothetical protein
MDIQYFKLRKWHEKIVWQECHTNRLRTPNTPKFAPLHTAPIHRETIEDKEIERFSPRGMPGIPFPNHPKPRQPENYVICLSNKTV